MRKIRKYMGCKKWVYGLLCIPMLILLVGMLPIFEQHKVELGDYDPADSTLGLCRSLYPTQDFPACFPYSEGHYYYDYGGSLLKSSATAFSVLTYNAEQYDLAKALCLRKFSATDTHQYQVGGYHFVEHLCFTGENVQGKYEVMCQYPKRFNMFAYNDSLCTLLFLGYYESGSVNENHPALTDFESFYNMYFSKYYTLIN